MADEYMVIGCSGVSMARPGPCRAAWRSQTPHPNSDSRFGPEVRAGGSGRTAHRRDRARGDDIGGISAHLGARVAALAGSREVLVSRTVRDLVAGSGLSFTDRGEHELKGVPDRWQIYAAVVAGPSPTPEPGQQKIDEAGRSQMAFWRACATSANPFGRGPTRRRCVCWYVRIEAAPDRATTSESRRRPTWHPDCMPVAQRDDAIGLTSSTS